VRTGMKAAVDEVGGDLGSTIVARCRHVLVSEVGDVQAEGGTEDAGWEVPSRRVPWWSLLLLFVVVVVVAARLVAGPGEGAGAPEVPRLPSEVPTSSPPEPVPFPSVDRGSAMFSEPTGTVLLFDDGLEGALAVHLDTGERRRVHLEGQRPGDQPFRLWRLGRELVVGWGEVHVVTPADGASRHLASATVFLPAAAPDQLWLIDDRGGGVGQGGSTWTLVDAAGDRVAQVQGEGLEPVRGVPGGMAVRSPDGGLLRYDVATERLTDFSGDEEARFTDISGDEEAWVADASSGRFVWCAAACAHLNVSDASGGQVATIGRAGETFAADRVWLAPDGTVLAAVVRVHDGGAVHLRLRVYDVDSGTVRADTHTVLGRAHGAWTEDSIQFFSWVHEGADGTPTVLGRWAGGDIEQVSPSEIIGVYGFVGLPEEAVGPLFEDASAWGLDVPD
jgi:hypothetical protein